MVRSKPSTCTNCGSTRRTISWSGLCRSCARDNWDSRPVTRGNRTSGSRKRKAAEMGAVVSNVAFVPSSLSPVPLSSELQRFLQPGYIPPSAIVAKLEKVLRLLHLDASMGPITLIEFPCGENSQFSQQALKMGASVMRIGISADTTHVPSPPKLEARKAAHWHVDLHDREQVQRLYAFFGDLKEAPGTVKCHVHSSPVCTGFTPMLNFSKGKVSKQTIDKWKRHRAMLRVVRRVHQILSDSESFQRNKDTLASLFMLVK